MAVSEMRSLLQGGIANPFRPGDETDFLWKRAAGLNTGGTANHSPRRESSISGGAFFMSVEISGRLDREEAVAYEESV